MKGFRRSQGSLLMSSTPSQTECSGRDPFYGPNQLTGGHKTGGKRRCAMEIVGGL